MTIAMRTIMLHPRPSQDNFKLYDEMLCLAKLCQKIIGPVGRLGKEYRARAGSVATHRRPRGEEGVVRAVLDSNSTLF